MMGLRYPTLDSYLLHLLKRINAKRDNWLLFTGEEGDGKSKTVRKMFRRLDYLMRNWQTAMVQLTKGGPLVPLRDHWRPNFPLPRPFWLGHDPRPNRPEDSIRFGQEAVLDFLVQLERGGLCVGDELEGSRRLAMHGERQELLDHVKETRALRHTVGVCFPQFTDFETTMTQKRFIGWVHSPFRGGAVVRERKSKGDGFDYKGQVVPMTKWPIVGRFPIEEGNDPWEPRYDVKKDNRMRDRASRRNPDQEPEPAPRVIDPQRKAAIDQVWASIVQDALKSAP